MSVQTISFSEKHEVLVLLFLDQSQHKNRPRSLKKSAFSAVSNRPFLAPIEPQTSSGEREGADSPLALHQPHARRSRTSAPSLPRIAGEGRGGGLMPHTPLFPVAIPRAPRFPPPGRKRGHRHGEHADRGRNPDGLPDGTRREARLRRARRKLPRAPRRHARRARGFQFVNARHEGGAAFMAEAHGKLTGEPGLCFVTRGPGATNAAIGIHTARQNSSPHDHVRGPGRHRHEGARGVPGNRLRGLLRPRRQMGRGNRQSRANPRDCRPRLDNRPLRPPRPGGRRAPRRHADNPRRRAPHGPPPHPARGPRTGRHGRTPDPPRPRPPPRRPRRRRRLVARGRAALLAREIPRLGLPVLAAFRFHDLYDNEDAHYAGEAGVGMLPPSSRRSPTPT